MGVRLDLLSKSGRGRRGQLRIVVGDRCVLEVEVEIPSAYQAIAAAGVQYRGITVDGEPIDAQPVSVYLVRERQDCTDGSCCQQGQVRLAQESQSPHTVADPLPRLARHAGSVLSTKREHVIREGCEGEPTQVDALLR